MSAEVLYFADLNENSGVTWTNSSNVIGSFGVNAANTSAMDTQEQSGGGNLENLSFTPQGISSFIVSSYDATGANAGDVIKLELWNSDTSAWVLLDTWQTPGVLPQSPTSVDYTSSITTLYDIAVDKQAFINGLKLRWRLDNVVKVPNDTSVYTKGCELIVDTLTTWTKVSPTSTSWKKTG